MYERHGDTRATIRIKEGTPVLDVAKQIAELSGNGATATYQGSYILNFPLGRPQEKCYIPQVSVVLPSKTFLAHVSCVREKRAEEGTAEEALLATDNEFEIISRNGVGADLVQRVEQILQ